jgi:hypothetical protein
MASPFAIFAGLAMVQPALDAKSSILEGLLQSYPYDGGAGGQSADGQTSKHANGQEGGEQSGNQAIGQDANAGNNQAGREGAGVPGASPSPIADIGGSSASGAAASIAVPVNDDDGDQRRGPLRVAAGAAAVLLIGLFSYVAVSSQGGDTEETGQPLLALIETSTPASPATATPPAATETVETAIEETATAVAAVARTATAVATNAPSTAVPGPQAPGTPAPVTPIPVLPGPIEPGITAPQPGSPEPQPQVGGSPERPITNPPVVSPVAPCVPNIEVSPFSVLDFGTTQTTLTFRVAGNQCEDPANFSVKGDEAWLSIAPASGRVTTGGSAAVTVSIDRDAMGRDAAATIVVSGTWGSVQLPVRVAVAPDKPIVTPTRPTLILRPTSTPTLTCRVVGGQTICQ